MNPRAGNSCPRESCKTEFLQWVVKWFHANTSARRDTQEKPDVSVLTSLFRSIGFRLLELEKSENVEIGNGTGIRSNAIRVVIECGNSGIKASLELDDVKCQCPNPENTKNASFWSVSGIGPTNASTIESANKIEETGSNLLPPVSKDTAQMISDVIYHLFNVIGEKSVSDANQNSKSRSNLNLCRIGNNGGEKNFGDEFFHSDQMLNIVRSHTQPEIVVNTNNPSIFRKPFNTETTSMFLSQRIDAERESIDSDQPRSSPPKIRSSPVFIFDELCSSLDSISLKSEEDAGSLATYVSRAHENLEKALEIIAVRRSPIHEQKTFLKPTAIKSMSSIIGDSATRRSNNGTGGSKTSPNGPNSRPTSSCSMPSRGTAAPRITLSSTASKATLNRRSVGSTSTTKIPIAPKSFVGDAADVTASKTSLKNDSAASKIAGRRKSFHSLRPLKLAVVGDKNTALSASKDAAAAAPSTSASKEKPPDAGLSAISKLSTSLNQSSILPTLKVAPIKATGQKDAKETTRRSVGNPRFGYNSKK